MTITTGSYEDLVDFATETLICNTCKSETKVSGPLPKTPTCRNCGSKNVTRVINSHAKPNSDRRAA